MLFYQFGYFSVIHFWGPNLLHVFSSLKTKCIVHYGIPKIDVQYFVFQEKRKIIYQMK